MIKSKISIIIPCFNSGQYLPDTLVSIKNCKIKNIIEVIIVDDGSTDKKTLALLSNLKNENYTIIHQENKGPAGARNTGVKKAEGEFLLFLDSDNKINENYFKKGISIFDKNPNIGIVHGVPLFFGDSSIPRFKTGVYNQHAIVFGNYIDMCVLMRKEVWEDVGEFDENKTIIGHEDWEYWIRLCNSKWKFHFLNEICFEYRIRNNSLIQTVINSGKVSMAEDYVFLKHREIILENYRAVWNFYSYEKKHPVRAFVKNILKNVGVISN